MLQKARPKNFVIVYRFIESEKEYEGKEGKIKKSQSQDNESKR